jgi:hypothetical protein
LAHQEVAGGVGSVGGAPRAAESTAAAAVICGGIGDGFGDSRHLGSIPSARNKRRTRRSFSASQWSSGRLLAAAEDGGHGGKLGYWKRFHGREGERPGRKGKGGGGGLRGVEVRLQDTSLLARHKQEVAHGVLQGRPRRCYRCPAKKT